jgi:hypothetical protein
MIIRRNGNEKGFITMHTIHPKNLKFNIQLHKSAWYIV